MYLYQFMFHSFLLKSQNDSDHLPMYIHCHVITINCMETVMRTLKHTDTLKYILIHNVDLLNYQEDVILQSQEHIPNSLF